MQLKHFENFDLLVKAEEIVSSLNTLAPQIIADKRVMFDQVTELIKSINNDIKEACTQNDLHIILYHFSKAKSACLVLEEILSSSEISNSGNFNAFLLSNNAEMISMLNSYIHLSRVNIIISIRRKKK